MLRNVWFIKINDEINGRINYFFIILILYSLFLMNVFADFFKFLLMLACNKITGNIRDTCFRWYKLISFSQPVYKLNQKLFYRGIKCIMIILSIIILHSHAVQLYSTKSVTPFQITIPDLNEKIFRITSFCLFSPWTTRQMHFKRSIVTKNSHPPPP